MPQECLPAEDPLLVLHQLLPLLFDFDNVFLGRRVILIITLGAFRGVACYEPSSIVEEAGERVRDLW